MILYREESRCINVVDEVTCNSCGEIIPDDSGCGPNFATLNIHWGYGSPRDGEKFQIELCEKCVYNKLLPQMTIQPDIPKD
jgi:hypothetical protein